MLVNRNGAIVIDSDKTNENDEINETKQRIKNEFEKNNMFCWITEGKEIENYLSFTDLEKNADYKNKLTRQCDKYELFPVYINIVEKSFEHQKVKFAKKIINLISDIDILDLKNNIEKLAKEIRKWNKKN